MRNRKRNRMKGYDYSRDNLYFITICVDGMQCCLGDIVDSVGTSHDLSVHCQKIMQLNAYGEIVDAQINWLENRYEYVVIHSKVVMPNHIHAVIEIDRSLVSDHNEKIKSLSELVGALKTTSSKLIRKAGYLEFKWKRSFHDHIIRSGRAYQNIMAYIDNNPSKWEEDKFYKK